MDLFARLCFPTHFLPIAEFLKNKHSFTIKVKFIIQAFCPRLRLCVLRIIAFHEINQLIFLENFIKISSMTCHSYDCINDIITD